MGSYDTIWANIKCPLCGVIQTAYFQTKDLECDLTELCEGDTTTYFDESDEENDFCFGSYGFIYPSADEYCSNCKNPLELLAITRNNRIIRVLDGRILSQETIFKPSVKYRKVMNYSGKYPSCEFDGVTGTGKQCMMEALDDFDQKWIEKHPNDAW